MNYVYGWWFSRDNFLPHGDGRPVVVGKTLTVKPPLEMCRHGLHFSRTVLEALQYAPGPILHMVRGSGEILSRSDKFCAEQRMEIARIDATDLLYGFARKCVWDVIHLWPAPKVVKQYLKTGNESLRDAAHNAINTAAKAINAAAYAAKAAAHAYIDTHTASAVHAYAAHAAASAACYAARTAAHAAHASAADAVRAAVSASDTARAAVSGAASAYIAYKSIAWSKQSHTLEQMALMRFM